MRTTFSLLSNLHSSHHLKLLVLSVLVIIGFFLVPNNAQAEWCFTTEQAQDAICRDTQQACQDTLDYQRGLGATINSECQFTIPISDACRDGGYQCLPVAECSNIVPGLACSSGGVCCDPGGGDAPVTECSSAGNQCVPAINCDAPPTGQDCGGGGLMCCRPSDVGDGSTPPPGGGNPPPGIGSTDGDLSFTVDSRIWPTTIEELLLTILQILIIIATPIVILFIILAGFLYVTANGNAENLKKATRAFTYAVIGAILIIGAVAIAEIIKNLVDAFR